MRNNITVIFYQILGVVSGVLLSAASAFAATQTLDEVIVTATKRGDSAIQDIPISIQAISGDGLREAGDLDFNDYYRQVPGISVNDQGPGDKRIIIRGVNSGGAGTVGFYFDEIIVTGENLNTEGGRQPDIKMFDMDRVEVLRGPQGTTFGSSSLSGTIRWLPNRADLDSYSVDVGSGLMSTRDSDVGWQADGMVNIPIIQDRLAVRLSGMKLDKNGYINTRFREDSNDDDTEAFRGMLTFKLTDELELSALAMNQDSKTHGRAGRMFQEIDAPASPSLNGGPVPKNFNTDLSQTRFFDNMDLFNLKLVYKKDWGTFTASSSLFDRETDFDRDASTEIENITRNAPVVLAADGAGRSTIIQPQNRDVYSHEIRFASSWNSPVQILFGGFLQKEDRKFQSAILTVDGTTGKVDPNSRTLLDRRVFTQVDEVAVFGEASWNVNERLNITGGLRWFDIDIDEQANAVTRFGGSPGAGLGPLLQAGSQDTIFKANISYKLTSDVLGYVQFAQGFRAGGTNDQTAASLANVSIPAGFGSDSLDNYELGIKSSWLDNRLTVNGSVYFIDWSDIQVRQQARATGQNAGLQFTFRGNGGAAEVTGVELEIQALPLEGLQLGMGFNYNNAELTEDLPIPTDGLDGDNIEFVPEFTLSLNTRYERAIGIRDWTGFIGGDWSYIDEQANRLRPTNRQFREFDSYSILNLRAGINGDDWSATLGIDNVFDEDNTIGLTFNSDNQPPGGFIPPAENRPWPRTISFTVRKLFDF